jgi:Tfp pilus assembly protein FimT
LSGGVIALITLAVLAIIAVIAIPIVVIVKRRRMESKLKAGDK